MVASETRCGAIEKDCEIWKESELAAMTRAGQDMEEQAQQYASCHVLAVKHDEAQNIERLRFTCEISMHAEASELSFSDPKPYNCIPSLLLVGRPLPNWSSL